jgi:CheY-like chemotaxis protein
VDSKEELRKTINTGLNDLITALEGYTENVMEIVTSFVCETPIDFDKLAQHIGLQQWSNATFLVHKLKARYGYLGLSDSVLQLEQWEDELLTSPASISNEKWINHFSEQNEIIWTELKNTIYYRPTHKYISLPSLPLSGKLVLVAENDEVNSVVFSIFIHELGALALVSRHGEDVLKLAFENLPDLLFMDLHVPSFGSVEIIQQLRELGFTKTIIALYSNEDTNPKNSPESLFIAGATEILLKPVSREIIREKLLKYLG